MKKRLVPIAWIYLLLVGCVLANPQPTSTVVPTPTLTATPTPTVTPTKEPEAPVAAPAPDWVDLAPHRQAMLPAFTADVDRLADVTRYWIDLQVDLADLALSGLEQVRYVNHEDEPLSEIVFRLLPNTSSYGASMVVRSVAVNGTAANPELRLEGSAVYVPLAEPLLPGQGVELALTFEGTLPTDPLAGYAQYGYIEGVLALPNAYPLIPVYDDEGWNVELAPSYGDATFSDTALYRVWVTLSAQMTLATSGVILGRQDNGDGTATYTCASGPMRDFNLVASEVYQAQSTQVDGVQVTSYSLPGDEEGGERALDYTARALRIYEELIGPYPFNELDVMATPTQAGGIEYPGLIAIAERLYGQEGGFFELATVHEVAHQWWYSLVGNDQLDEPWLDEALTQYTSLLYFERRYGAGAAQQVLENVFEEPYRRLQENGQDMAVGLPVEAYPEELYGAVVYGKGPLFFHALRQQVGDETFYEILRTYFQEHRYGVAYPQDFLALAERVSGQELDALYEKWILGKEKPVAVPSPEWADLVLCRQAMLPAHANDVERFADATRYWIDLDIDLAGLTLRGWEWVRYTNCETGPLAEVVFRLLPNWPGYDGSTTIQSVTVDGAAVSPDFRLGGSALYVPLAQPLSSGAAAEVELAFTGTIPTEPLAGRAKYGYANGILALPNAYPLIPVYDDEGWNAELAALYGDPTFTDTSLYRVRVTLPAEMVLVASGTAVGRAQNDDGTATYTYVTGPMRDFYLAASARYRPQSTLVGQVVVTSYYLPEHEMGGHRALDHTAQALRIYRELLGPYPFTELDVVETVTVAGALEYPGLVAVAGWVYDESDEFLELVVAHEVAHQWWYNLVGNDQLDEPWLDEALTEYTTILYLERRHGLEYAQEVLELYFEEPYRRLQKEGQDMPIGLPVRAYAEDLYGPVIYGKGPLFFHAMREQMGDETFIAVLQEYLQDYCYSVAYPENLMAVAERVSGQELDALYERWILGE